MVERKIIHIIRTRSGDVMATARGVSHEAACSWRESGCEIFAFEVELPIQVAADVVQIAKAIDG